MKILRLELFGFKSFKDKTVVTFDQPITAIIGSNGCGKSNVVDALYWVMGDMSPKHLRGSSMTDVIFSGSRDAAALDMAEVTLVMERDPAVDPELPPQFQASNEIQITRRYFRSGDSEYLINKVPCRLRDIQEFFMDTGMGAKAYSIVEQGAITRMISLKPEDRRVVIEEVAGIMKFKARRAETERKIENSKLNLQRVDDIVQDLQKQLASLKRQADKAEKFKVFSEQLKQLEIRLATREWSERSSGKSESMLASLEFKRRFDEIEVELSVRRESFERSQETLSTLESELGTRRDTTRTFELALKDMESELNSLRTRHESITHRIEANVNSVEEIGSRSVQLETELQELLEKIALENEKSAELGRALEQAEEEGSLLTRQVEELRQQLNVQRKELHAEEISQTRLTQQIQGFQRNLSQLDSKKSSLTEQLQNLDSEIEVRNVERQSTLTSLENAFATRSELESAKLGIDAELARLETDRSEKLHTRDTLRQELAVSQIRKEQLEALERDLDGIDSAAKTLTLHRREKGFEANLLADLVKVPTLLEKAVESVLGRNLQRVVASSLLEVEELRSVLAKCDDNDARQGRAPLWVPSLTKETVGYGAELNAIYMRAPIQVDAPKGDFSSEEAIVASFDNTSPGETLSPVAFAGNMNSDPAPLYASESVEAPHSYSEKTGPDGLLAVALAPLDPEAYKQATPAPVATETPAASVITVQEYLLSHPEVVGPLDQLIENEAPELAQKNGDWLNLLKEFWVVRSREGLIQLARDFEKLPLNFVSLDGDVLHRNGFLDLAPVEAAADEQSSGLLQRKRVIADLEAKVIELTEKLALAQMALDDCILATTQAKDKFRELTSQLAALNPDVERYSVFLRQVEAQVARLSEKKNLLGQDLVTVGVESEEIGVKLQEIMQQLSEAEARKNGLAEVLKQSEGALEESQAKASESSAHLSELRSSVKRSDRDIAELQTRRAAVEQESNLIRARRSQLEDETSRLRTTVSETDGLIEESSIRSAACLSELRQSQDIESELTQSVSTAKTEMRTLQSTVDRLNSDSVSLSSRLKDLEQNIAIHDVEMRNIAERVEQQYQIALASLDEVQLRELSAASDIEELATPEVGKKHAGQLRQKIDNLGKINMVAIEEFEDLRHRHEYLFIQRTDLDEGIRQLRDAIDRIDRESKERFGEAFHAVNAAFQKTFPLLFGGGNAELRLTVPDNMLETGVEIVAQPPGKKLQSVTLLSGGEKALTAVSLIFGIFSIKPSPFCVLDEVDAPLDDANVGRFNNLVRKITDRSQVIMITHHKKTMESCDALFGVTMEKPGISKVASVRLGELRHEDFLT